MVQVNPTLTRRNSRGFRVDSSPVSASGIVVLILLVLVLVESGVAAPGDLLRTFTNPDPVAGDRFGFSLAALGDDVVVGSTWISTGGDGGDVHVFDYDTGQQANCSTRF